MIGPWAWGRRYVIIPSYRPNLLKMYVRPVLHRQGISSVREAGFDIYTHKV